MTQSVTHSTSMLPQALHQWQSWHGDEGAHQQKAEVQQSKVLRGAKSAQEPNHVESTAPVHNFF